MTMSLLFTSILSLSLSLDIQATVNSIQIGSAADDIGVADIVGVASESTDYQAEYETESEVEAILQDSSDVFYSFSDDHDTEEI